MFVGLLTKRPVFNVLLTGALTFTGTLTKAISVNLTALLPLVGGLISSSTASIPRALPSFHVTGPTNEERKRFGLP